MKKRIIAISIILMIIIYIIFNMISYAGNETMYIGINARHPSGTGYSIGRPGNGGKELWDLRNYNSTNKTDESSNKKEIYCLKGDYGSSWKTNVDTVVPYNLSFDLQKDRDKLVQLLSNSGSSGAANAIVSKILNTTNGYYRELMWVLDNAYLAGKSNKTELLERIGILYDKDYDVYYYEPKDGYDYSDRISNYEYSYVITDSDIRAVQQAVIWYFMNAALDGDSSFDKRLASDWLTITTDGTNYTQLGDSKPDGPDRDCQAKILYNYLIDSAKKNAASYTQANSYTLSKPIQFNSTGLSVENGKYKVQMNKSGSNYIIGPIKINKNNELGYTISLKVKNSNGTEIAASNYELTNSSGTVLSSQNIKDSVGNADGFYIRIPTSVAKEINIDIAYSYNTTQKTLWLKGTQTASTISIDAEQPASSIELQPHSESFSLTAKPDEFDLALRKYITKINNKDITTLGQVTRNPNISQDSLKTGTTATYKHKKDPILVKKGDSVTYKITIYNEGNKNGYAKEITDQLPTGLKYTGGATITSNKNTYKATYNETTNKVTFTATTSTALNKYENNTLDNETLEFTCEVTATPDTQNDKILTNVAWISGAYDSEAKKDITNVGDDIDSRPQTSPNVNKDNMNDYKGNTKNQNDLTNKDYYYEGEQDDDDFEKLKLEPEISITVNKKWEDNNNQDGIRPTSITVKLYANGAEVSGKTVTLNSGNNWTATFSNLPLKSGGKNITYTVKEATTVSGYTTTVSGYTITNKHEPEKTQVSVEKKWEDNNNQDGKRPTQITVTLYADGAEKQAVTLNSSNSWKHTFSNLPKKVNGKDIVYTVKETGVTNGYTSKITGDMTVGFVITNTYTPENINIPIKKVWNDENNQDGVRPKVIEIILKANGTEKQRTTLTGEGNEWTYTFSNLPKYENGKEIIYTVEESGVPEGYSAVTTGNVTSGFIITNSYTPGQTSVKVTKIWEDNDNQDGIRATTISVSLLANGTIVEGQTVDLNEENKWTHVFEKLPLKLNGKDIEYTIQENTEVEGYTTKIDKSKKENNSIEITITNKHESETTELTVNKIWDDEDNYDKIRPVSITVILLADGESKQEIVLNEENKWTHKFENLPKKSKGKDIVYTVKEKTVPEEYTEDIIKNAENNYTIKNYHKPNKIFDLALRKYIIKINDKELKDLDIVSRNPNISEDTLKTDTTATYKHKKDPVKVKTNDIITYAITIYNEGEKSGYANQIIDQLPTGLIYIPSSTIISKDAEGTDKNTYTVSYDTTTNKITFDIKGEAKDLKAYSEGKMDYETLEIKCKIVHEAKPQEKNILTNVAWISGAYDTVENAIATDRDSQPETKPDVNKDNMEDYKGKEDNKDDLTDKDNYYKGEQDDDDFEKLYVQTFDLSLRKFISQVNNDKLEREPVVDVTPLANKTDTTAIYNHPKTPVSLKAGDTVIYTIRVYNEGEIDGYANEVKDYLPPYLLYVEDSKLNQEYGWEISEDGRIATTKYLSDKEIKAFGGKDLDYKDLQIECKISKEAIPHQNITNIAEISEYKYEDTIVPEDIDSKSDNVEDKIPEDKELPEYKDDEIEKPYVPGNEDDDDFEKVYVQEFDLALRKFITQIQDKEVTSRIPQAKYNDGKISYEHPKDPLYVHVDDVVIYTIRIYNEGEIDGYASEITDDIPEYLEYLPEHSTNVEYMWKMYDKNGQETENVGEAEKLKTTYLSKERSEDNLLTAFDGETLYYKDIKIAFKVKDPNSNQYIITNHAQISDDTDKNGDEIKDKDSEPDEWNEGEDDQDIENIKVEYFDLSLLKFVTKVIVIEDGKESITETGYNGHEEPEPVVKVELHKKKLSNVIVKFGYGITITNEGDIAGYAKEITDYVPEGLRFEAADNPNWKDEGNNVISTRQLEGKLLQPGESVTIEVILTWINGPENLALKTNTAEISEDDNEYDVPDKDSTPDNKKDGEDDIDIAKVILSIATGTAKTYFILTLGLLVTISVGIILIKKFVL